MENYKITFYNSLSDFFKKFEKSEQKNGCNKLYNLLHPRYDDSYFYARTNIKDTIYLQTDIATRLYYFHILYYIYKIVNNIFLYLYKYLILLKKLLYILNNLK